MQSSKINSRTEICTGIFAPLFGESVDESKDDNVVRRVVADFFEGQLIASLTPVHSNVRAGGSIEDRGDRGNGGGQEAECERTSEHGRDRDYGLNIEQ